MADHKQARAAVLDTLNTHWSDHLQKDDGRPEGAELLPVRYFGGVSTQDLRSRSVEQLFGAMRSHWRFGALRRQGESLVRAFAPEVARHGWISASSVLEIVTDDSPFLVDSVSMALRRCGHEVELIVHPVLYIQRTAEGELSALGTFGDEASDNPIVGIAESFMHFEFERVTDSDELETLVAEVQRTLRHVHAGVGDWKKIRARTKEIAQQVHLQPLGSSADLEESAGLLDWIASDHFTLLGAADFLLEHEELTLIPGTELGVLRAELGEEYRASNEWDPAQVLLITKSEFPSLVHRASAYDVIGTKTFNEHGEISGERRIIGHFTSEAYVSSPSTIPVLRRKVGEILERSGFPKGGHASKKLGAVLDGYPRDELFAGTVDHLETTAMSIVQLQERRRVRLFVRRDVHRRVWTALVFLPRDRFTTEVRFRIQRILLKNFNAVHADYTTAVTDASLARLYFVLSLAPGQDFVDVDVDVTEEQLADTVRSWTDGLREVLADQLGDERGRSLFGQYASAFSPAYTAEIAPRIAVADLLNAEVVRASNEALVRVQIAIDGSGEDTRLKIYVPGKQIALADLLPMLANLGLRVVEENANELRVGSETVWIHDLGVSAESEQLSAPEVEDRLHQAFLAIWTGESKDDGFNKLILHAGMQWREVNILRSYARYLRQLNATFSQEYIESTLHEQAPIAHQLVHLFHALFDPRRPVPERASEVEQVRARINASLESVAQIDQDRILRSIFQLIEATVRTNYYQVDENGRGRPTLAFKMEPGRIADAPLPRPRYEIFVSAPRVEGVHLRMGTVARGGIRWSERPEDFRTEVLGLMKAQAVKNAVIVPAGAKGGFVVRNPLADRQAMQEEVVACYKLFIGSLLDLTDNLVSGGVVPPNDTIRRDGDDPYLVVAADKGTATFSDIANELSLRHGFWLGDAFASGGSVGYDHKAMGITARGAWESVKRHLHRLEHHPSARISTVGIGDMSGDVFGNGMLLSDRIALIAAFDHRHIFIDPNPDLGRSFDERKRLFSLPRSSWDDFDRSVISEGGGVFPRTSKSISITATAAEMLGIDASLAGDDGEFSFTPHQLINQILKAPVDLLWNGGIGTYVKASTEPHAAAGDRANDGLRADANQLRCKIVGEGGNLGFTQRARIEFARQGGFINTDAIDNSAGVDTSDHEVNLKILLDRIVANGDLTGKQRNAVLAEMTQEVAELVLDDNISQNRALVNVGTMAPLMIDVHSRYMSYLEQVAKLDRSVEALPDMEALSDRKAQGAGLTIPELAVLLAYTKLNLTERLIAEGGADDPAFEQSLRAYFPRLIQERFSEEILRHPLRTEITATAAVNHMVNVNGITYAFRMMEETQAQVSDIVRAHMTACQLFAANETWEEICSLGDEVPDRVQAAMLLEIDRLVERTSRWVLRNRRLPVNVMDTIAVFGAGVVTAKALLFDLLSPSDRAEVERRASNWTEEGVPQELALRVALMDQQPAVLDIVRIALAESVPVEDAATVYFAIDDRLGLGSLRDRILSLPRDDRWSTLARAALRDDLAGEHVALTSAVLKTSPALPASERLEAWSLAHPTAVERHFVMTREVDDSGTVNVSTMSVVLRELRTLAGAR